MNTLSNVLTTAMEIAVEIDFIVVSARHRTHREADFSLCAL